MHRLGEYSREKIRKEGDKVPFFQKVREIKEKSKALIAEHKPHRRPKEKRKLPLAKKVGFLKFVIWGVIVVVGTSGLLALARAQNALGKSKQAVSAVLILSQ